MDITMIGHISQDIMEYVDGTQKFTGGPVIYSSAAARCTGKRIRVITAAAAADDGALDEIRGRGIDVIRIDSPATTSIHNVYHTADCEKRDVTLLSQASSFTPDIEQHLSGEIIHLAGLFRGEIPDELIPVCQRSGKVALDAQGVLRCNDGTSLSFNDWKEKRTYLPMVTYLKTDAAEAFILTGTEDRVEAARMLIAWGAGEVMVTHNREVIVASHDQVCRAPYTPKNLSGRTGRGDTTFAAYLAWRIDHPIDESVRFAAALCSLKMEAAGPFSGSLDDVFQRMRQDRS